MSGKWRREGSKWKRISEFGGRRRKEREVSVSLHLTNVYGVLGLKEVWKG